MSHTTVTTRDYDDIYDRHYYFHPFNKYTPHFSDIIKSSPEYDISFPKLVPVFVIILLNNNTYIDRQDIGIKIILII